MPRLKNLGCVAVLQRFKRYTFYLPVWSERELGGSVGENKKLVIILSPGCVIYIRHHLDKLGWP